MAKKCDDMADDMAEIELLGIDWTMTGHIFQMPPVIYNVEIYIYIYTLIHIFPNTPQTLHQLNTLIILSKIVKGIF